MLFFLAIIGFITILLIIFFVMIVHSADTFHHIHESQSGYRNDRDNLGLPRRETDEK